jgi:hypothetical protein
MWTVLIGDEFEPEFLAFPKEVQDAAFGLTRLLQQFGPSWDGPGLTPSMIRVTPT